ncbi:histidine phosphatase family protein [Marivita sp. XM-24bin2]|jgi:broad specificity phosphatase PhoE|uniref:histidine phosphatase family protein n=1 Tax=unclassified Marivita TaxID=2632480 RepID=UPI000D7B4FDB|nr:histidine phosphatase family protein [Marivita sp. XM-24bin2]MCR9111006.1 histidine phosphatase family protein [Paracoccaceae bacterium]PWL33850.1 MAG: histidine phosphatase family protein [Marivita sp. XM-24bin2]
MSQIVLVRHGQANTGAKDEGDYDKLSKLGHQQSGWLGEHFRHKGDVFARVWTGTLRRHIETADGIAAKSSETIARDERLNELEYFTLSQLLADQHGITLPSDREGFVRHLPCLFQHWRDGKLEGTPESFDHFENRVRDALRDLTARPGRSLVVTSGGLIGMAMRLTLELNMQAFCNVCLSIQNTSVSFWLPLEGHLALTQFNALPHLDTPDRLFAQTHF